MLQDKFNVSDAKPWVKLSTKRNTSYNTRKCVFILSNVGGGPY